MDGCVDEHSFYVKESYATPRTAAPSSVCLSRRRRHINVSRERGRSLYGITVAKLTTARCSRHRETGVGLSEQLVSLSNIAGKVNAAEFTSVATSP